MEYYMSNDNAVIQDITIEKRVNNSPSTFTVTFATPLHPDEFTTGMDFEFIIVDGTRPEEIIAFNGKIESVKRDEKDGNRIYAIVGRNDGRLFTRQPFKLDCDTTSDKKYSYNEVLDLILTDTGVTKGRGLTTITGEV